MAVAPGISAETIIFAINSAIKLSRNLRQLYAKKVKEKEIVLPLPDFDTDITLRRIVRFFNSFPEEKIGRWDGLAELHHKALNLQSLTKEEQEEYEKLFLIIISHQEGHGPYIEMSQDELLSLFKLHGAGKGEQRSVLQLVAGSLVEIGVDYFTQVPGALNRESVHGQVLYNFLLAFDDIDFAEHGNIKKEFSNKLLPRLFAAAAESVAGLSDNISNDENFQLLIKATAKGIANDIYARAEQLDALQREEAIQWGQLVLRSIIKNGGEYVLAAPEVFLDTNQGVSNIIQSSGLIILETILADDSDKIAFKKALSPQTLERLTKATLALLTEHPQIISKQEGVRVIIEGVSEAIQQDSQLLEKGIFPELVRIILEQSAGHLELLWSNTGGTPRHLLLIALKQILSELSEQEEDGSWHPQFTKWQLLELIEELLEEVVHNPAWVLNEVNDRSILAEVVRITLAALRQLPKEERLQPEVLRMIIRLNLETTIANPKVLDKIPWGTTTENEIFLQKALELVITFLFQQEDSPKLNRLSLLMELLEYISTVILREHPNEKGLLLIQLILFESGIDYKRGFDSQLADELIDAGLQVLSNHPSLAEKPDAFHQILVGVLAALDSAQIRRPDLVVKLIKLILNQSALHAHLIIKTEEDQPKYLLVIILKQLLESLSEGIAGGNLRSFISFGDIEHLLLVLIDEVIQHPYWLSEKVEDDALLKELLNTIFEALEKVPPARRLAPSTLEMLLRLCLQVVATSPKILDEDWFAEGEDKQSILQHALELTFAFVAMPKDGGENKLLLLPELLDLVLGRLLVRYPDKRGLILADLILFEHNGIDYSQGVPLQLAEDLADAAFAVIAQHPELVTNDQLLKQVVTNVAANLSSSGINQPHLLRELIRLTLESTAEHLDLLLDESRVNTRHLFVMASWQVLNALAQPVEDGKWKPRLSNTQILDIIERIYLAILENPQWADEPLFHLLRAVFLALQQMPKHTSIPYLLIRHFIDQAIEAANRQRNLLIKIETADGTKMLRLQYALEGFITTLYNEDGQEELNWYLSQAHIIEMLVEYYLQYLSATPVLDSDIQKAQEEIETAIATWKEDLSKGLEEILYALQG